MFFGIFLNLRAIHIIKGNIQFKDPEREVTTRQNLSKSKFSMYVHLIDKFLDNFTARCIEPMQKAFRPWANITQNIRVYNKSQNLLFDTKAQEKDRDVITSCLKKPSSKNRAPQ